MVRKALRAGANPNSLDVAWVVGRGSRRLHLVSHFYKMPLHYAARCGDSDLVWELIDAGAWVDGLDYERREPLFYAATSNRVHVAKLLMDEGVDVAAASYMGETALQQASHKGHLEVAKQLLSAGGHPDHLDTAEETALVNAAARGRASIAELLLDHGADVNRGSGLDGTMAPSYAMNLHHTDVAKLLVARGADPYDVFPWNEGETPITWAVGSNDAAFVSWLLELGFTIDVEGGVASSTSSVYRAVEHGAHNVVRLFMQMGVVGDAESWECSSLYRESVRLFYEDTARLFTEHGCDVNCARFAPESPLTQAIGEHCERTACFLVGAGSDVDFSGGDRTAPVINSILKNQDQLLELLLETGADVNVRSCHGQTALWAAVWRGDSDVVKLVLSKGADPNTLDPENRSLLHQAMENKDRETFMCLRAAGGPSLTGATGNTTTRTTAFRWCSDRTRSMRLIRERRRGINGGNRQGQAPLRVEPLNIRC
ncbi:hypothetical protein N3K66_007755 [Trichothecium roseum]|uniref:Uncharacterized protein n=1 Tax=Trichothecium roseum TaxID=47278 RepID=A0ACC0UWM8_9HYPO|nr:hypothetical protein N3K66_007755 [Trichothecium roseum]